MKPEYYTGSNSWFLMRPLKSSSTKYVLVRAYQTVGTFRLEYENDFLNQVFMLSITVNSLLTDTSVRRTTL